MHLHGNAEKPRTPTFASMAKPRRRAPASGLGHGQFELKPVNRFISLTRFIPGSSGPGQTASVPARWMTGPIPDYFEPPLFCVTAEYMGSEKMPVRDGVTIDRSRRGIDNRILATIHDH